MDSACPKLKYWYFDSQSAIQDTTTDLFTYDFSGTYYLLVAQSSVIALGPPNNKQVLFDYFHLENWTSAQAQLNEDSIPWSIGSENDLKNCVICHKKWKYQDNVFNLQFWNCNSTNNISSVISQMYELHDRY